MMCIKYSENIMCAKSKAQNTPFIIPHEFFILEAINRQT